MTNEERAAAARAKAKELRASADALDKIAEMYDPGYAPPLARSWDESYQLPGYYGMVNGRYQARR